MEFFISGQQLLGHRACCENDRNDGVLVPGKFGTRSGMSGAGGRDVQSRRSASDPCPIAYQAASILSSGATEYLNQVVSITMSFLLTCLNEGERVNG